MKAVIGLGNPGEQYRGTRHNIGFLVVDEVAKKAGARFKKKHTCLLAEACRGSKKVLVAKPQTFMNCSGEAVRKLRDVFSLRRSDFIIVHDDLDLAFGRLQVRSGGGAGGHRGVASVQAELWGEDFFHVRIGIGRPGLAEDPVHFVLSSFSQEEQELVPEIVHRSADAVWCLISEGSETAMNRFNRKKWVL